MPRWSESAHTHTTFASAAIIFVLPTASRTPGPSKDHSAFHRVAGFAHHLSHAQTICHRFEGPLAANGWTMHAHLSARSFAKLVLACCAALQMEQIESAPPAIDSSNASAPRSLERRAAIAAAMRVNRVVVRATSRIPGNPLATGRLRECAVELCPSGTLRIQPLPPSSPARGSINHREQAAWPVPLVSQPARFPSC